MVWELLSCTTQLYTTTGHLTSFLAKVLILEVKRFFEDYKALENKAVVVEDFLDRAKALESITQAIARYWQHRHALIDANRKEGA